MAKKHGLDIGEVSKDLDGGTIEVDDLGRDDYEWRGAIGEGEGRFLVYSQNLYDLLVMETSKGNGRHFAFAQDAIPEGCLGYIRMTWQEFESLIDWLGSKVVHVLPDGRQFALCRLIGNE